jgi:hypothetical protein
VDMSILGASRTHQKFRFEHTYLNCIHNTVHDTSAANGTSRSNVMSCTVAVVHFGWLPLPSGCCVKVFYSVLCVSAFSV